MTHSVAITGVIQSIKLGHHCFDSVNIPRVILVHSKRVIKYGWPVKLRISLIMRRSHYEPKKYNTHGCVSSRQACTFDKRLKLVVHNLSNHTVNVMVWV